MSEKPTTYQDWRDLLHENLYRLGGNAESYMTFAIAGFPAAHPCRASAARLAYQRYARIKRIKMRIEAEREANTSGYVEAQTEMIMDWLFPKEGE